MQYVINGNASHYNAVSACLGVFLFLCGRGVEDESNACFLFKSQPYKRRDATGDATQSFLKSTGREQDREQYLVLSAVVTANGQRALESINYDTKHNFGAQTVWDGERNILLL